MKKSLHSLFLPCLYCNIIKSISCLYSLRVGLTVIINPTDRQHKPEELNKQQAFNSELYNDPLVLSNQMQAAFTELSCLALLSGNATMTPN